MKRRFLVICLITLQVNVVKVIEVFCCFVAIASKYLVLMSFSLSIIEVV